MNSRRMYVRKQSAAADVNPAGAALRLTRVPFSRSAVFESAALSLAEKRQLMRFVQAVMAWAKRRAPTSHDESTVAHVTV